jgi:DNA-directed RNA polymerase subunit H (RpoH/RPB5)
MSNLNYTLSLIYNNLFVYFKYKKLTPLISQIDDNEFIKTIYNNEYYIIPTTLSSYNDDEIDEIKKNYKNSKYNNSKNFKIIYIILFHYNSEIYTKTIDFKKIIQSLKDTYITYDVITITKTPLSTHVTNFISTIQNKINIIPYTYKLFTIIIPNHILSNKHEILNKDEEEHLLNNVLFCKKFNLPKIKLNDPQIIWSHGQVNDIVKITRYNDITGISLYYRVIIK